MFKRLSNTDKSNLFLIFVIGMIQDFLSNPNPGLLGAGLGTIFMSIAFAIIIYFVASKLGFIKTQKTQDDTSNILDKNDSEQETKSPNYWKSKRYSDIIKIAIIVSLIGFIGIL